MRLGRTHRPYYRIVAMQSTRKREGKALDFLGQYDPLANPKLINLDMEKYNNWIAKGAQPTDTVRSLARKVQSS